MVVDCLCPIRGHVHSQRCPALFQLSAMMALEPGILCSDGFCTETIQSTRDLAICWPCADTSSQFTQLPLVVKTFDPPVEGGTRGPSGLLEPEELEKAGLGYESCEGVFRCHLLSRSHCLLPWLVQIRKDQHPPQVDRSLPSPIQRLVRC